jgi:hypothetical protein
MLFLNGSESVWSDAIVSTGSSRRGEARRGEARRGEASSVASSPPIATNPNQQRYDVAVGTSVVFVVGQMLIPAVTSIHSMNLTLMMWTTLVVTFLIGIAFTMQFGSILGFGAIFPPSYTTAIMSGMGISGVMVGLLRIITKASLSGLESGMSSEPHEAHVMYGITLTSCMCCLFYAMCSCVVKDWRSVLGCTLRSHRLWCW